MSVQTVDQRVLERMDKILALKKRAGTEGEMLAAAGMLQKLMEEHNLTLAEVERAGSAGSAVREKAAAAGGMYEYQRRLWRAVGELNFCAYRRGGEWITKRGKRRWRSQHLFVGRRVNVAATLAMGSYLQAAADRLCRERLEARMLAHDGSALTVNPQSQFFSTWAVAFREGVADRLIEKLQDRRQSLLDRAAREAELAARAGRAEGAPASTALTLLDVAAQEDQGNYDFVHGEGAWARCRAREAEYAREREQEEAAYTAWARAHPAEAKRKAAEEREEARKYWARRSRLGTGGPSGADRRQNSDAYDAGHRAGDRLGIDPQTQARSAGALRHG